METKKELTFGDIKNDTVFYSLSNEKLFKMGCYGISGGKDFIKFDEKDPVKLTLD